jgi:hypothetical protein
LSYNIARRESTHSHGSNNSGNSNNNILKYANSFGKVTKDKWNEGVKYMGNIWKRTIGNEDLQPKKNLQNGNSNPEKCKDLC